MGDAVCPIEIVDCHTESFEDARNNRMPQIVGESPERTLDVMHQVGSNARSPAQNSPEVGLANVGNVESAAVKEFGVRNNSDSKSMMACSSTEVIVFSVHEE